MSTESSPRRLRNRARTVAKLFRTKPSANLAFNFVNFQSYQNRFLAANIRHPTQVFILDKFILLSQIFITNHGTDWFFHTHSQLQKSLGMSPKTIKKVTDILVAKKILLRKKSGRTGKTFYKLQYSVLMRCYRSFLNPDLLEDKPTRDQVYVARLRYFAYIAKFCRLLHAKPEDVKAQPAAKVEPQKAEKQPKRTEYSDAIRKFAAEEFGEALDDEFKGTEYEHDLESGSYDAYPTGPKPFTLEEMLAQMKIAYPHRSKAFLLRMIEDA